MRAPSRNFEGRAYTDHRAAVLLTGDPELTSRPLGCRVEDLRRWCLDRPEARPVAVVLKEQATRAGQRTSFGPPLALPGGRVIF
jgi:hypothetical protein